MTRASIYTPELVDAICLRLADGETLASVCRDEGMPSRVTVYNWMNAYKDIAVRFAHARELGEEAILDDILQISDDGRRDYKEDKDGREVVDHDHIQRAKLRVDSRFKLLAIWNPGKYSQKVDLNHGGQKGNPLIAMLSEVTGSFQPVEPSDDDA